jgi:hypothetical protein
LEKEVKNSCHPSEKAEEELKEAKEAAVSFNAQIAGQWCHVIRQKGLLVECHSLSLS